VNKYYCVSVFFGFFSPRQCSLNWHKFVNFLFAELKREECCADGVVFVLSDAINPKNAAENAPLMAKKIEIWITIGQVGYLRGSN